MQISLYFYLSILILIFLCPVRLNGKKSIHLKVLWSIFEENREKIIKKTINSRFKYHRFNLILRRHGNTQKMPVPRFNTDKFDTFSADINDDVDYFDVEIRSNESMLNLEATFTKLEYKEGQIYILPINANFPLTPVSVAFNEIVFSRPVRNFRFVFSGSKPLAIECVESALTVWRHDFHANNLVLNIEEAVCKSTFYRFTFLNSRKSIRRRNVECDEPIFELGFVNHFAVVYNEQTKMLICSLSRSNDAIQRIGTVGYYQTSASLSKNEAIQSVLAAYKEKIDEIMANYEEQRKNCKNQGNAALIQPTIRQSRKQNDMENYANFHHQQHVQLEPAGSTGVQNLHTGIHGKAWDHAEASGSDEYPQIQTQQREEEEAEEMSIDKELAMLLQQGSGQLGQGEEQQEEVQAVLREEASANAEAYKKKLKELEEKLFKSDELLNSHEKRMDSQMIVPMNYQMPQPDQHNAHDHPEQGYSSLVEQMSNMAVEGSYTSGQANHAEQQSLKRKRPVSPAQQVGAVHTHPWSNGDKHGPEEEPSSSMVRLQQKEAFSREGENLEKKKKKTN